MTKLLDQFRPKNILNTILLAGIISTPAVAETENPVKSQKFSPRIESTLLGNSDSLKIMKKVNKVKKEYYGILRDELQNLPEEFNEIDSIMFCPQMDTIVQLYSSYEDSKNILFEFNENVEEKKIALEEKKKLLKNNYIKSLQECLDCPDEDFEKMKNKYDKSIENVDEEIRNLSLQQSLLRKEVEKNINNIYKYLQEVAPKSLNGYGDFQSDMVSTISKYNNEQQRAGKHGNSINIPELVSILGEVLLELPKNIGN